MARTGARQVRIHANSFQIIEKYVLHLFWAFFCGGKLFMNFQRRFLHLLADGVEYSLYHDIQDIFIFWVVGSKKVEFANFGWVRRNGNSFQIFQKHVCSLSEAVLDGGKLLLKLSVGLY